MNHASQTITQHKDIAKARAEQLANQRDEGEEKTEGDPFEGQLQMTSKPQTIQERPNKGSSQDKPQVTEPPEGEDSFVYRFSPDEVQAIITSKELPESVYNQLLSETVERAFEN